MKKRIVKENINRNVYQKDDGYLDQLYFKRDDLTAEYYVAEEKKSSVEYLKNINEKIKAVDKIIELEEIEISGLHK